MNSGSKTGYRKVHRDIADRSEASLHLRERTKVEFSAGRQSSEISLQFKSLQSKLATNLILMLT